VRLRSAALLAGGVAYALIAASTTPFTLPADAFTGVAIAGMAAAVCVCWPLGTRKVRAATATAASGHPYLPWILLAIVFVVWELFNYLVHSSITDAIDRTYALKTLMFLGWLAFGWVILRRGSRSSVSRARASRPHGAKP
jgi:hypothetical protein